MRSPSQSAPCLLALILGGCCLGTADLELREPGAPSGFLISQTDQAFINEIRITLEPYSTTLWELQGELKAPGDGLRRETILSTGTVPDGMEQSFPPQKNGLPSIEDGDEIVVSFEPLILGYGHYIKSNTPKRFRKVKGVLVEMPIGRPPEGPRFLGREERLKALREIDEEIQGLGGRSSQFLRIARDPDATPDQKRTIAKLLVEARTQDLEAAYRELRTLKSLVLFGYGGTEEGKIADLSPLADLKNLRTLVLPGQRVSDLSPLAGMVDLEFLRIEGNRVENLAPLSKLVKLRDLSMSGNRVTNLAPLSRCRDLFRLQADDNLLSDLSPLDSGVGLQELKLKRNKISDLAPLRKLRSLTLLDLEGNDIKDLGDWTGMTQLCQINLANNRITDLTPLETLFSKEAMRQRARVAWVYLTGNPIQDETPITRMRARGVHVE